MPRTPPDTRLLERYARHRRPEDLEALVIAYRPLAHALVRRYSRRPAEEPDLQQAACEGLVKALQRFDPQRGTPFKAFAVPTILGEVRRLLRDTSWPAHVPRKVQDRVRAVRELRDRGLARDGRAPTPAELAGALGCTEEDVVDALCAQSVARTLSLDAEPGSDLEGLTLAECLGGEDPAFERVEDLTTLERAFPALDPDQQTVIRLHFGDELTQRQIAACMGFSRSQAGRMLNAAIERLRVAAAA